MKKMKDLINEQSKLIEELETLNVHFSKKQQTLESLNLKIEELKEQQDYGSFRFVLSIIPNILDKIITKHKIHSSRTISLDDKIDFVVSASNEKCSDENPINVCKCDRCTVLHFGKILGNLLSNYYAK